MFARGTEIAVPAKADFKKANRKPVLKPKLMATITKAMGTEINTAARQEKTIFLYFFFIFTGAPFDYMCLFNFTKEENFRQKTFAKL